MRVILTTGLADSPFTPVGTYFSVSYKNADLTQWYMVIGVDVSNKDPLALI